MNRSGVAWLAGLVAACAVAAGRAQGQSGEANVVPPQGPVLAFYRECGLPVAPGGARVVLIDRGWYVLNDQKTHSGYDLGFLLQPGGKGEPARVLVGTQVDRVEPSQVRAVDPIPAAVRGVGVEYSRCPFA